MKSCVIHPRLSNGEKSPLFTRLKKLLGDHTEAAEIYYRVINPDFKNVFPNVRFDENDEPYLEDLINQCGITYRMEQEQKKKALNEEYGTKEVPVTLNAVTELQQKAAAFNKESFKGFNARPIVTDNGVKLAIEDRTENPKELAKSQQYNAELNSRLIQLLNTWGFNVGALEAVEERSGINGVMDLSAAETAATGLKTVIRIAKGIRGQMALPEEWGHFVVEAVESQLKDRILNTLNNEEILQRVLGEEYEHYYDIYNGDIDLMAREALGKMMAKVLNSLDPNAPNDRLFQRYKDQVLNQFKDKDETEIDKAVREVQEMVYSFTERAYRGEYQLNTQNLNYQRRLYNLGESVSRERKLLERIITQEEKRLAVYGAGARATEAEKKKTEKFEEKQKAFLEELREKLTSHKEVEGIYKYLHEAINTLDSLSTKMAKISDANMSMQQKFTLLRNVRNYLSSYTSIIDNISKERSQALAEGQDPYGNTLRDLLRIYAGLAQELGNDWITVAKDEFADFLKEFEGEAITMTIRGNRKQYTIRELLDYCEQDISIIERWIDSAADSRDPFIRIYDSIVKSRKNQARLKTIDDEVNILAQSKKLEQAGVDNTTFMYEKDDEGKATGNFVTRYNTGQYSKNLKKFIAGLDPNLTEEQRERAISAWKRTQHTSKGDLIDAYLNPQYDEIQNHPAKKAYYDFIMKLKKDLEYKLPMRYVKYNRAPQIRRDFIQRMMQAPNKGKYFWETIKDNFVRREDDVEVAYAKQDFEGNQIHTLPIYYTKTLANMDDLSLDCTSTMIAYASMANDYASMEQVVDALEVGVSILKTREVYKTRGGKALQELVNKTPLKLYTKGEVSNMMARLNDFMLMQVYGEMQKDEGTVLGVDVGKFVNVVNRWQSFCTTAASVLTGTANMLQNIAMSNIEAMSKVHFSPAELAKADREYTRLLPSYLGEIGQRIKTNKLHLFDKLFNVTQDYKSSVREVKWDRKTIAGQLFNENALWFTTSAGDHYTQHRTALALALRFKVQDKNGKPISFYDALEVQYVDPAHPEYGAKLVIKEGTKDEAGNPLGEDYIDRFTKRVRGINDKLYGIYNQEDKNAWQSRAAGRLFMMYRNWMRPLYLKRYGVERYNMDTEQFEEGYYRTLWNFMNQLRKDLKEHQFDFGRALNELSGTQRGNLRRAVTELVVFGSLTAIIAALHAIPDDKDKENNWLLSYVSYAIVRLRADMGAMMPGPTMLDEGLRLFDSPVAAIRVMKNLRQLLTLVDPSVWTTEIEQGIWKGYTKAEKALLQPLPFVRQFKNLMDPDESARWYK